MHQSKFKPTGPLLRSLGGLLATEILTQLCLWVEAAAHIPEAVNVALLKCCRMSGFGMQNQVHACVASCLLPMELRILLQGHKHVLHACVLTPWTSSMQRCLLSSIRQQLVQGAVFTLRVRN